MEYYTAMWRMNYAIHSTWMDFIETGIKNKARHKKEHIIWFHFYDIHEQAQPIYRSRSGNNDYLWAEGYCLGGSLRYWKYSISWCVVSTWICTYVKVTYGILKIHAHSIYVIHLKIKKQVSWEQGHFVTCVLPSDTQMLSISTPYLLSSEYVDLHLKMLTPKLSRVLLSIPCEIYIYRRGIKVKSA